MGVLELEVVGVRVEMPSNNPIVLLRDRLMALEAEMEAHPHIPGDDASTMAGYVRRCYGSLTTFNVLFEDRDDYFSSSR